MTTWIKISDEKPPKNTPVFISDGACLSVANYEKVGDVDFWNGEGFSGYEWDWDFEPTHWAKIEINLPVKE